MSGPAARQPEPPVEVAGTAPGPMGEIVWHDLECGRYRADLYLWEELAAAQSPPERTTSRVLDLGAGSGRVSLHLAERGHQVTALDLDASLLAELGRRAASRSTAVETMHADARDFELGREFDLVVAPMQLLQLLRSSAERACLLGRAQAHLRPGGLFAAALLDLTGEPIGGEYESPLPDMCELDGWVYSSAPMAVGSLDGGRAIVLDRLRRAVSPEGRIEEARSRIRLELPNPTTIEREARAAGLRRAPRQRIAPTDDHMGSVVVIVRRDGR